MRILSYENGIIKIEYDASKVKAIDLIDEIELTLLGFFDLELPEYEIVEIDEDEIVIEIIKEESDSLGFKEFSVSDIDFNMN